MDHINTLEPIGNESVVEKIINQMIHAINSGQFPKGTRLPGELELTKTLCVSRNSLREAIKFLTAMGILEVRRGEGTFVCSEPKPAMFDSIVYSFMFESSTNQQIVELRQALDEIILRMGIRNCSEEDIQYLESFIVKMKEAFRKDDISGAAKNDYAFHMYLIDCCRNPFLIRIVKGIYMLFEQSIEKNIRTEEFFANAVEHHEEMVYCLKSRDEGLVRETVEHSLSSWKSNVNEKIRK